MPLQDRFDNGRPQGADEGTPIRVGTHDAAHPSAALPATSARTASLSQRAPVRPPDTDASPEPPASRARLERML